MVQIIFEIAEELTPNGARVRIDAGFGKRRRATPREKALAKWLREEMPFKNTDLAGEDKFGAKIFIRAHGRLSE